MIFEEGMIQGITSLYSTNGVFVETSKWKMMRKLNTTYGNDSVTILENEILCMCKKCLLSQFVIFDFR